MGMSRFLGQFLSRSPKIGPTEVEGTSSPKKTSSASKIERPNNKPRDTRQSSETSVRKSSGSPRRKTSRSSAAPADSERRNQHGRKASKEDIVKIPAVRRHADAGQRRRVGEDNQRLQSSSSSERKRRGSDSKEAERRRASLRALPRRKHSLEEEMLRVRKISLSGTPSSSDTQSSGASGGPNLNTVARTMSVPTKGKSGKHVKISSAGNGLRKTSSEGTDGKDSRSARKREGKKNSDEKRRRKKKRERSSHSALVASSSDSTQSHTEISARAEATGSDASSSKPSNEDEILTVTTEELFEDGELGSKNGKDPVSRSFRDKNNGRPVPLFQDKKQRLEKLRKREFKPKSSLDKFRPPPLKIEPYMNNSLCKRYDRPPPTPKKPSMDIGGGIISIERSDPLDDTAFLEERAEEDVYLDANIPTLGLSSAVIRPAQMSPNGEIEESQFVFEGGTLLGDTGFSVQDNGWMHGPQDLSRKNSDGSSVEGVPKSTHRVVTVESLNDFQRGPDLGAGYAGSVYLAVHGPTGLRMAVKEVNVIDHDKRKQLLKELETLTTHVSRFLVRFYGAFFDRTGAVRIALEYMDRGSLCSAIKKLGPVPEPVVNRIAKHCLHGLEFLHGNRVLHRDLKTANILLSRHLIRAKLSDFGLAREVNPGVSKANTFVGTLAYMSPERLEGGDYTYASDIWGLGISLVECILGRYPFDNPQTFFDFLEAVKTNPHTLIGTKCSEQLVDFVKNCTYTDPKKRPTAQELLLHPWIAGTGGEDEAFEEWLGRIPEVETDLKGRDGQDWEFKSGRRHLQKLTNKSSLLE